MITSGHGSKKDRVGFGLKTKFDRFWDSHEFLCFNSGSEKMDCILMVKRTKIIFQFQGTKNKDEV